MTVKDIKKIGKERKPESLEILFKLYEEKFKIEVRREIVSSIGRHPNKDRVLEFMKTVIEQNKIMDLVYQAYRTCLYNNSDIRFKELGDYIVKKFDNEMIYRMKKYFDNKGQVIEHFNYYKSPLLLEGDSSKTLKKVKDDSVHLVFTSPPYYNAKEYSSFHSYKDYLRKMKKIMKQCYRVLEPGRYIVINVSPVITRRPGREFGNFRYPIHFDFHRILTDIGFDFTDEIIWIKQEPSVPRRIGGYLNIKKPLTYKPNSITESLLVYKKEVGILVDENLKNYENGKINFNDNKDNIFTTNCWRITPKRNKNHPAVFPEKLCENVLKYYSFKNDVVLDPFAGSGTLGEVALNMKRVPILCEMDHDYIELINKKMERGIKDE